MKNQTNIALLHKVWQPLSGGAAALKDVLQQEELFFSTTHPDLRAMFPHVSEDLYHAWINARKKSDLSKIEYWLQRNGIHLISVYDEAYPSVLRHLSDPPTILYYMGNLSMLKFGIGIVGSRHADDYGNRTAFRLGMELSKQQLTVVSGLAKGIDAYGHKGALEGVGGTIAVQGCGLDIIYPKTNQKLAKAILEHPNGCIVSEFALGTSPEGWHFPRRNRIISAFSRGIVVVQAGTKSGVYSTLESALNQGKDIFAVPGEWDNPLSYGPNLFIQEGAMLITGSKDILHYYDIPFENELSKAKRNSLINPETDPLSDVDDINTTNKVEKSRGSVNFGNTIVKNLQNSRECMNLHAIENTSADKNVPTEVRLNSPKSANNTSILNNYPKENWELPQDILLTDDEKNVLLLFQRDSLHLDELIQLSGKSVAELSAILSMLEVYGLIEQQLGRNYMRIR